MLSLPVNTRILAAVEPVDMRKSFNGLYAVVAERLKENPVSGALFLFTNKRRDRLKVLYWDGTGILILAKRLEKGRFSWPASAGSEAKVSLRAEAFNQIICGVQLNALTMKPWYRR